MTIETGNELAGEPCGWIGCDDPYQNQTRCPRCIAECDKIRAAFDFIKSVRGADAPVSGSDASDRR